MTYKKILSLTGANKSLKNYIASNCSNISWDLLTQKRFEEALIFAKTAKEADPNCNILYTNLALAYLFNENWGKAKEIYQIWKDSTWYGNELLRSGFLDDIKAMERTGITHPNFKKVKTLLEEGGKDE